MGVLRMYFFDLTRILLKIAHLMGKILCKSKQESPPPKIRLSNQN